MVYIITHTNDNGRVKIHLSTRARKIADFVLRNFDQNSGFKIEEFEYMGQIPNEYKWITD